MSDEEVTIEETSKRGVAKSFDSLTEEARGYLAQLEESGITELQDQIRELSERFPSSVVSKVLHVSGKQVKRFKNPDARLAQASDATTLEFLEDETKKLTKSQLQSWFKLGKLLESMDLEERARMHDLASVEEYVRNALNFYDCFENLVLNLRFASVLAE
jgi:hypothetical protein